MEVWFEKENIETMSGDDELMLTVLSSFAQEESKNVSGIGCTGIARRLRDKGIKTVTGLKEWNSATIPSILKNEKYKGDAILQKTYVPDHIKKKAIENKEELYKYYLADDHPPIVVFSGGRELQCPKHHIFNWGAKQLVFVWCL